MMQKNFFIKLICSNLNQFPFSQNKQKNEPKIINNQVSQVQVLNASIQLHPKKTSSNSN